MIATNESQKRPGTLCLLSLPIGNLGDITQRVMLALQEGSFFLAEDTRHFKDLLKLYKIPLENKSIWSFHDHSDLESVTQKILPALDAGETLYVVSDAGSPMLSDPAYPLVQWALKEGRGLDSFGGVSSVTTALELSGLPPHPFLFWGFLAREKKERQDFFHKLEQTGDFHGFTHVLFEAPHRIRETLQNASEILPDWEISLVREISKKFQSRLCFLGKDFPAVEAELVEKGEMVLCLRRQNPRDSQASHLLRNQQELTNLAMELLEQGVRTKSLSQLLGLILDRPSKEIYARLK